MRRARLRIGLALLAIGATVVAALTLSGGHSATGPVLANAPQCLPRQALGSARLAGGALSVSPAPGSTTANPQTQISLLGAPPSAIGGLRVEGSRSGRHSGRLAGYSQRDGASFLPARPFSPGERVNVSGRMLLAGRERGIAFSFTVETPYSTAGSGPFPNPTAPAADLQSFRTLPGVQAPLLSIAHADSDPAAGDVFMTNGPGPGRYGPLIYSPQGRLIWFEQLPAGLSATNLSVQRYARQSVLSFWQGRVLALGFGQGEDLILNNRYEVLARVPGGNGLRADLHEFQLTRNGVAYITAYNPIRCDLAAAGGSRNGTITDSAIQEIDVRSGLVRWEWHSVDHIATSESHAPPPGDSTPWDWFHINSIDAGERGRLLICARSTWAGYLIDEATGGLLWQLGGRGSSFQMQTGTQTAWPHDARLLAPDEVSFFDDGANPPVHERSRALRIHLDSARRRASLVSALSYPQRTLAASQGNAQTLADGNVVIGYGGIPLITEQAPDGRLLFAAHMPLSFDSYRAYRFPWRGYPHWSPSVSANLNNTGEETELRASYNGATDVATWQILAGESAERLSIQGDYASEGFESDLMLTHDWRYVQARALDASGKLLGSSAITAVGSYSSAFG